MQMRMENWQFSQYLFIFNLDGWRTSARDLRRIDVLARQTKWCVEKKKTATQMIEKV